MSDNTIIKVMPVSGLLTGSTNARRESVNVSGLTGLTVTPDSELPIFASFGTVSGTFASGSHALPFQVGDQLLFTAGPEITNGSTVYAYVWKFWDGTREASVEPYIEKRLNMGGNPVSGTLAVSVIAVGYSGEFLEVNGELDANNPPTIVSPTVITANQQYFPFQTQVKVRVFDFENDSLTFGWYTGDTLIGSGTTTSIGALTGTWSGNDSVLIINRAGYENYLETTVESDMPLTLVIRDAGGGTTTADFNLYGEVKPPPVSGLSGGSSATSSSLLRIGQNAFGTFSAYAKDATGLPVQFQWQFAGSNNWTTGPVNVFGTTVQTADGGYANSCTKDISGETVTSGTQKTATALVFVSAGGVTSTYPFTVTLVQNRPPTGITFSAEVNGAAYNLVTLLPVAAGSKVELIASADDPDNDLVECMWSITQPGTLIPTALTLWGAKIVIDTTSYGGNALQATVMATDVFGGNVTESTPAIPIV